MAWNLISGVPFTIPGNPAARSLGYEQPHIVPEGMLFKKIRQSYFSAVGSAIHQTCRSSLKERNEFNCAESKVMFTYGLQVYHH